MSTASPCLNPEPRTLNPLPLPPTSRDFEIHRAHFIQHLSTRRLAELHTLSQTRIRQIVAEVNNWLAANLPTKTDVQLEQETRLAQHLAAAQLQEQCEELQTLWSTTFDPKYLRQKTRAIQALARLGVLPGSIDALTVVPSLREGHEAPVTSASQATPHNEPLTPSQPETWNFEPETSPHQSEISNPKSGIPCPPPSEDCSPSDTSPTLAPSHSRTTTSYPANDSNDPIPAENTELAGLSLLENRLLTLLANTPEEDSERCTSLTKTLESIRRETATLQINLSPNHPVHLQQIQPHPQEPTANCLVTNDK